MQGWATKEGTARFHTKAALPPWAVRRVFDLSLAAIGVGTYTGTADAATDAQQIEAIVALLSSGCNVIDCAPNYRNGRAERSVGKALARALAEGIAKRDAVFVATKAGLVPETFKLPSRFVLGPENSCYDPEYLLLSLEASLERLQLATVDCVFVHNLEILRLADGAAFPGRFAEVAACMERIVEAGLARSWGISSWSGFRVREDHPEYLSLDSLLACPTSHLRYLQFPVGLWGSEAITGRWQRGESILARASAFGIFAASPLLQGELAQVLRERQDLIEDAVCFARDARGVDVAVLGIKKMEHVMSWKRMQQKEPRNIAEVFAKLTLPPLVYQI